MLITDINTAGASSQEFTTKGRKIQININGTWNGGTVSLQKKLPDDSWVSVYSWTENAYDIIETVGSGTYRTNTAPGGSAPDLKCDVVVNWPSASY